MYLVTGLLITSAAIPGVTNNRQSVSCHRGFTIFACFVSPHLTSMTIDDMTPDRRPKIAVIGACVIGLSTAIAILEQIPSAELKIFTEQILSETTSIGAAGLFRPEATSSPGDDESAVKSWAQTSYQYFSGLARSANACKAGIQIVSGFHVGRESYERCLNSLTEYIVQFKAGDMSTCELNDIFGSSNQLKYGRTMGGTEYDV